jgi:hypothetical protein
MTMGNKKRADRAGTQDGSNEINDRRDYLVPGRKTEQKFLHCDKYGVEHWFTWPPSDGRRVTQVERLGPYEYCWASWSAHSSTPWEWRQRHLPEGEGWRWTGDDFARMLMRRPVKVRP